LVPGRATGTCPRGRPLRGRTPSTCVDDAVLECERAHSRRLARVRRRVRTGRGGHLCEPRAGAFKDRLRIDRAVVVFDVPLALLLLGDRDGEVEIEVVAEYPLSGDDLQYFESRFFLVPGTGTVYVDAKLSVIRRRAVGDGFHEELTILNHDTEPVELTVRVEAASDFADLFEVKDALKKKGKYSANVDKRRLLLTYERDTYKRQTAISASAPARLDDRGLTFDVSIAGHGSWTTDLDVVTAAGPGGTRLRPKYERGERRPRPNMERSLDRWRPWQGRPAAVVFYSCFLPRVVIALTPGLCRACWSLLHPWIVRRVGVHGRAAVIDGFGAQFVVPGFVAVDLA
jgi:hypothetical protein